MSQIEPKIISFVFIFSIIFYWYMLCIDKLSMHYIYCVDKTFWYVTLFWLFIIPINWNAAGSWNPSSWKIGTCLSYLVNTMAVDNLATQGARASAAMVFILEYCSHFSTFHMVTTTLLHTCSYAPHLTTHDDEITWGLLQHYWPSVQRIPTLFSFTTHRASMTNLWHILRCE